MADWQLDAGRLHVDCCGFGAAWRLPPADGWPWYTDHFRLAALVVFPSVLLAGIGLGGAVEGLFVRIMHYIPREKHAKVAPAMMGAAMVLVLAVAGLSSRTPAMHDATLEVAKRYQVTPTSDILNQDEMNVINEIPEDRAQGRHHREQPLGR